MVIRRRTKEAENLEATIETKSRKKCQSQVKIKVEKLKEKKTVEISTLSLEITVNLKLMEGKNKLIEIKFQPLCKR